ncbi:MULTISPECIES: hypothetical protein [Bacillaceae]|jgi:membrane protein DedA with SNARE-associated domain|uniref:Uncharacterized protein n=1 Tax=Niallia hominis TaxID=3133173 RepID=A0ABV1EW80_9BACI|nr:MULTISPECIES: hypothetical protein [Bacillaceae]MCF2650074.1 hypothetical protein [Niallia circulans]REB73250.1 hypothetical protein CP883_11425 [Cutibacterium acnes]
MENKENLLQVQEIITENMCLMFNEGIDKMTFKKLRYTVMGILIGLAVVFLILVITVTQLELNKWQDTITLLFWIYMILVFVYIIFINLVPLIWKRFKKSKDTL